MNFKARSYQGGGIGGERGRWLENKVPFLSQKFHWQNVFFISVHSGFGHSLRFMAMNPALDPATAPGVKVSFLFFLIFKRLFLDLSNNSKKKRILKISSRLPSLKYFFRFDTLLWRSRSLFPFWGGAGSGSGVVFWLRLTKQAAPTGYSSGIRTPNQTEYNKTALRGMERAK